MTLRKLLLGLGIGLGLGCSPGSGEYSNCNVTADCQIYLTCVAPNSVDLSDGGLFTPASVCRYSCGSCSTYNEVCGSSGYCSTDGGY